MRNESNTDNPHTPRARLSIALTLVGILVIGVSSFLGYSELSYYARFLKAESVITNIWFVRYSEDRQCLWF